MGLLSGHLILIFGFNGQKTLGPFLAPSGAQEVSVRLANSALFLFFRQDLYSFDLCKRISEVPTQAHNKLTTLFY